MNRNDNTRDIAVSEATPERPFVCHGHLLFDEETPHVTAVVSWDDSRRPLHVLGIMITGDTSPEQREAAVERLGRRVGQYKQLSRALARWERVHGEHDTPYRLPGQTYEQARACRAEAAEREAAAALPSRSEGWGEEVMAVMVPLFTAAYNGEITSEQALAAAAAAAEAIETTLPDLASC